MSRYIDADAMDKRRIDYIVDGYADSADDMAEWGMAIIEAPSIEIVRCRECKNSYTVDFTNTPARVIKRFCRIRRNALTGSFTVQDDDFCSYGCRKESE